jgi:AmmeMemoRadiSam system protein B
MGKPSANKLKALSGALHVVFQDDLDSTLFIVSSCLSKACGEDKAQKQAEFFIETVLQKDRQGLNTGILDGSISACGAILISALMESRLLDGKKARFLQDEPGKIPSEGGCVCYGSIAFE